ncbi:MAG: radical SAM protein [Candidatus Aminicenantes bacterium]|nr:radical SAM protein [Candidatus Aminicenantes bacterium]
MKIEDLSTLNGIKPLKYPLSDTPHATIETNRTCNLQCRSCYNLNKDEMKSLSKVKEEIDLIVRKRNLQVITLLGGEPTLHPKLPEIVNYVKSKGLLCQLLTNGIVFLQDDKDVLLEKLIQEKLDKIIAHIDSGQKHFHKNIEIARGRLFSKLESKKICFSLSVTIYNDSKQMLGGFVKKYAKFRYFDGILAVLARDPLPPKRQHASMEEEYVALSRDLRIEPAAYIPSIVDDKEVSWMIYLYFLNSGSGDAFGISPMQNRIFRKFYRLLKGHHFFIVTMNRSFVFCIFLLSILLEALLRPAKSGDLFRFLRTSLNPREIRLHYIALQNPPEYNEDTKELHLCCSCPDATIRNGKLTPVCIADFVNPASRSYDRFFRSEYNQAAYAYLKEA